jgi:serine/threonine-protein kinase
MRVTLQVVEGPHAGRAFTFDRHDTFLAGRSTRAHLSLPEDRYFSRIHFMLEINPPLCRLLDMNSRNGTRVNGTKVESHDLHHGDRIRVGHSILEVALEDLSPLPEPSMPPWVAEMNAAPSSQVTLTQSPTSADPVTLPTMPTIVVPGYRIERELGRGGMGIVFQAVRAADGNVVALKTIIPAVAVGQTAVERFLREAGILKQVRHPHVIQFCDMGMQNEMLWFAMDFVNGPDAGKLVKEQGPLEVRRACRLILQLLDGLAAAHQAGFVHRDIKPANILVADVGSAREAARIADFGLARTYQASQMSGLTMAGAMGGTPAYMPPEQVLNFREAKPPADLYSVAGTLYHLVTGQFPYDRVPGVQAQIMQILEQEPVPLRQRRPDLPAKLEAVIQRGLAKKAEDRYPDAASFARVLKPFAQ